MGAIADAFNTWLRGFVVEGVPGSGANPPDKAEGRAIGPLIEAAIGPEDIVIPLVGGAQTLVLDHNGAWLEIDDGGAGSVVVTVPTNADVAFPVPCNVYGRQAASGQVSFVGDTGVTVEADELSLATTACAGAVFQLRQIDTDVWILFGKLEAA